MRRILIDECINPRLALRLRTVLPKTFVETVRELGWTGWTDQRLVPEIGKRFDVFLTIDKGFEFERDLTKPSFAIVVLTAANNQMHSYERLLDELIRQIPLVSPGRVIHVIDPEC